MEMKKKKYQVFAVIVALALVLILFGCKISPLHVKPVNVKESDGLYVIGVKLERSYEKGLQFTEPETFYHYIYYLSTSIDSRDTVMILNGINERSINPVKQKYSLGDKLKLIKE